MKTKNEIFHAQCGMLEAVDKIMRVLREKRVDLLDKLCEIMNDIFVSDIEDLGFRNVHFSIDEFECDPELCLWFEETSTRNDFGTEEEWLDYQLKNIEICYDYFEEQCSGLDIICLPREEYDF
jgi:hypothetical protein